MYGHSHLRGGEKSPFGYTCSPFSTVGPHRMKPSARTDQTRCFLTHREQSRMVPTIQRSYPHALEYSQHLLKAAKTIRQFYASDNSRLFLTRAVQHNTGQARHFREFGHGHISAANNQKISRLFYGYDYSGVDRSLSLRAIRNDTLIL